MHDAPRMMHKHQHSLNQQDLTARGTPAPPGPDVIDHPRDRVGHPADVASFTFAGAAMAFIAACWAALFPYWPYRDRLVDLGKMVDYNAVVFAVWILGIVAWVGFTWVVLDALRGVAFRDVRFRVSAISTAIILAFGSMYPTNAIDVFIYAVRSRLFTEYGENPNAVEPIAHIDTDRYMQFASKEWADDLSPYGPLWNLIAAPITWIGHDSITAAVIGFKVLSIGSVVLIAFLVYDIVRQRLPEWALAAALAWLWNPLVLWDGVANAHNDVVLMVPVMLGIWAWVRGRDGAVIPLLILSVLIKYITVLLIPIALVAVWRRHPDWQARRSLIAQTISGSGLAASVGFFPFYDVAPLIESVRDQGAKISTSPAWAVITVWHEFTGSPANADVVRAVGYGVVFVFIGFAMWRTWQMPEWFPRACFEALFVYMLVASTNQRPWYVIWIVPLAAILLPAAPWARTLTWSVTALLQHVCTIYLWYVWDFGAWGTRNYLAIIVAVIFVPVIMVTALELIGRVRDFPGRSPTQISPR
jgi:hypothetical protein